MVTLSQYMKSIYYISNTINGHNYKSLHLDLNKEQPTRNNQQGTTNKEQPTRNNQQGTTNKEQPTKNTDNHC